MIDLVHYRRMNHVQRLAGTPKLRSYTLAEHCFHTGIAFARFAKIEKIEYDINVLEAVLSHDILEVFTGDLIYTAKNLNESTKACWSAIEDQVANAVEGLDDYTDSSIEAVMTEQQHTLFKACDLFELHAFLQEEFKMGNRDPNVMRIISTCSKLLIDPRSDLYFKSIHKEIQNYG